MAGETKTVLLIDDDADIHEVIKMILAESAVMGLLGGALGIFVGMGLARVFVEGANSTQGYDLAYQMPLKALVFAVAVSLGVSQIAALWPSRRGGRRTLSHGSLFNHQSSDGRFQQAPHRLQRRTGARP